MAMKSDKRAFQLFSSKGKVVKYKAVLKAISKADIVFFGELHNNAISHWMEYELAKDLIAQKGDKIVLGAEMYEADGQLLIDEYLSGLVKYKYFKGQARLWPNDPTDYKPLLQLAHDNKIPFIATNVPRRYASAVNKGGFEILEKFSDEAKRYFAPLPIQYDENVACYKSMQEMMGAHGANIALHKVQQKYVEWLQKHNFNYVDISGNAENLINYYSKVDLHIGYRVHAHIFMNSISKISILLNEDGRGKALEKVIGGMIFDSYNDINDSLLYKVLHKLSIRLDNYDENNFLINNLKNSIMYELNHGIKFSQPKIEINRHFNIMKEFIEQLP